MRNRKMLLCVLFVTVSCQRTSPGATPAQALSPPTGQLPAPGTFTVDPTHANVLFKAQHEGAGYVYGWFRDVSGRFVINGDPATSHVELTVKTASLDTRDEERNGHLVGPDFLNAAQFPTITFKSTHVERSGAGWRVTGDLTIRGVTKTVATDVVPVGDTRDPQGQRLLGIESHLSIQRADFGLTFMPEIVGPTIDLLIALEGDAA